MNSLASDHAQIITQLACSGFRYGPLWNDKAYVMQCLIKYLHDEGHGGAIGWKVEKLANFFAYSDPYSSSMDENRALARLLELGAGSDVIA